MTCSIEVENVPLYTNPETDVLSNILKKLLSIPVALVEDSTEQ